MPKRKSKPIKGSGQPVAKKREIESNEADSTPVVRGRSRTRGAVSTPAKAITPAVRVGGSAKKRVNAIKSASKKSAPIISADDESDRSSRSPTPVARTTRSRTPARLAESQSVVTKAKGRTPKTTTTPISPSLSAGKKAVKGRTPRSKTPAATQHISRSRTPVTASPPVNKRTRSAARQPIALKTMTPVITLRPVASRLSAKSAVTTLAIVKRTDRLKAADENTKKLSPKKLSPFAKANSKSSPKKTPKASSAKNSPASKKEVGAISTIEPQPPRSSWFITQRCCVS